MEKGIMNNNIEKDAVLEYCLFGCKIIRHLEYVNYYLLIYTL
jgi:hypothetical protein